MFRSSVDDEKNLEVIDVDHYVKLLFGKYRGKTFGVAAKDWRYCSWIKDQPHSHGQFDRFKKYLNDNAKLISDRNFEKSKVQKGTLSQRVRGWDLESMRDKKIITAPIQASNLQMLGTKKPRCPVYAMQFPGALPEWDRENTEVEQRRVRTMSALGARFLSYVFRRMIHEVRNEPVNEPLIADKALLIIKKNYLAYKMSKQISVPVNDPDGKVNLADLENHLKRCSLDGTKENGELPDTFMDCFSRLGLQRTDWDSLNKYFENQGDGKENLKEKPNVSSTPRRILLRYLLNYVELRDALETYRNIDPHRWSTEKALKACWILARADGAFEFDKVINEDIPENLLNPNKMAVYKHMNRQIMRYFSKDVLKSDPLVYGPCIGFEKTGCTLDVDFSAGETAFAIRGGMWVSSAYDTAYLQGYAALARKNGIKITRLVMIYLQHAGSLEIDVSDWDHTELLEFLKNDATTKNACDLGICEEYIEEKKMPKNTSNNKKNDNNNGNDDNQ